MDDLSLALHLADVADELSLAAFRTAATVRHKPDGSLVSATDVAVERALRAELARSRPADAVHGEEFGGGAARGGALDGGRIWIIDPIDHTNNYIRGIPVYATLIALAVDGVVEVGVVSAPAMPRRWWAWRGAGAHAEGAHIGGAHADGVHADSAHIGGVFTGGPEPLRVSAVAALDDAHISFAALSRWEDRGSLPGLVELSRRTRFTFGSGGFWAQMLVAEGRLDACLDPWGEVWDLAAVQLIVEEAGGRLTDLSGRAHAAGGCAVVTNGLLHDTLLAMLAPSETGRC
ncbi:inositol monophosphatase family protein [Planobispora longispora]|uniref:inositol-phosphate phosphatase n=1 Tax=Planobispora longispora TaxID=28887 RepID=A0A8J3RSX0_9ACTN|nr:inositol monophosphatase family protein [Planobispora longispora]GIH81202.1 histidinol-phosphatase [Planobispora longispora]